MAVFGMIIKAAALNSLKVNSAQVLILERCYDIDWGDTVIGSQTLGY